MPEMLLPSADNLPARVASSAPRIVGTPSHRSAHKCHAQLGDGVQEVRASLPDTDVLWHSKGAQSKAPGLEQAQ